MRSMGEYTYTGSSVGNKIKRLLTTKDKLSNKNLDMKRFDFILETTHTKDGVEIFATKHRHHMYAKNITIFRNGLRIFCRRGSVSSIVDLGNGEYSVNSRINNILINEKIRIVKTS